MKFTKIIETCIYSTDLEEMKNFYINYLGLEFVSEEKGRSVFLKAGKSMLLIFNPLNTLNHIKKLFPIHGAITPPSIIHFALEIQKEDYEKWKDKLQNNKIDIEKEIELKSSRSIYFRDPAGNLVEFITNNAWPVNN
jgi:catechol-2,3-dioxygenase